MSVKSCEKVEKSQVALTIEVEAQAFEAALAKAYRKMSHQFRVPGFRPGKAPQKMIEKMYGVEVLFDEAVNIAFPDAYEAAVKEKELTVVGYPAVELVGECTRQGFTFKAVAPVYPEVTLGQYKGLSAPKREVAVSEEDVARRLDALAERNTRLESVEREAKEGDTAVIDFEGFLDGEPFDGGKGESHSLELGSHSFVPGFEEQVVGMKAGDEKDIDITFPEDYHKDLAGKAVVFKVKCHEVKEKQVPAMDDDFAKDVSEFDTLEELKADLEKKAAGERQKAVDQEFEEALMNQVEAGITAEIPDVMVERQARQFLENFKSQIAQQGIPYEQYMEATGMQESKLLEDAREPALKQVRMDLAVAEIVKTEGISASDEDVEEEYQRMAKQFGMDAELVKKYLQVETIRDQICTSRAIEIVTSSAVATEYVEEEAPAEAEQAPAEAEEDPAETPKKTKKPRKKKEEPKAEAESKSGDAAE